MLLSLSPKLKPKPTRLFRSFHFLICKKNNIDMELGLSLGHNPHHNQPSKTPFGFIDKAPQVTNKGSSFCMALSIATPSPKPSQDPEQEEVDEYHKTSDPKTRKRSASAALIDGEHTSSCVDPTPLSLQLDLLPNTPVPRNHRHSFPWSSDNGGSNEVGCSGKTVGFLNVNKKPTIEEADQGGICGGATLSSSPPNSSASSFQMDVCMYSKGGSYETDQRASSRASDDDENGGTRKKLRLSKEQSAFLEESFKEHSTLNPKQKVALAKQLNLRPRQVEVWFQNRRARTKLKQTEVDCEYLKRCCETLTEENRRLHKELQELRALKTSTPFYMQLPATTLTMCPSCERVATTGAPTTTTATNNKGNTTDPSVAASKDSSNTRPRFYPFSLAASQAQQPNTRTS